MTQPIAELTDRMREIFGLVVESYLERGHPVGSKILAGSVNLSPASIRNVMQDLEERGLLTHPHTSAGRVPTESGLRLFVDGIMQATAPDPLPTAYAFVNTGEAAPQSYVLRLGDPHSRLNPVEPAGSSMPGSVSSPPGFRRSFRC